MKLSLIVVNHNACKSLKQTLNSLINACKNIDYELFIVDNASTDRSLEMLENYFPEARVIANEINQGIAKANNQALKLCTGEYVLLVNADTITGKESLEKMIGFMDQHADTGGLSVRMLSHQGRFIAESIHGLTESWASFFKLIGFAKYLSKTRLYNRNRKDWVEEFQINEIDILNEACMLLRSSALNETGLFDEHFFLHGHNIDLSYRIRLAGYKNYYFPKTYIITSENQEAKFSWSNLRYFYGAMFIFAHKYLFNMPELKVAGMPQLTYEVK